MDREEIGDERVLMMDANQKWNADEAVINMKKLIPIAKPIWIEEPTNCDDVVGHANIAKNLRALGGGRCGVATGEAAANKVIFKQLLQREHAETQVDCSNCSEEALMKMKLPIPTSDDHYGGGVSGHTAGSSKIGVASCGYDTEDNSAVHDEDWVEIEPQERQQSKDDDDGDGIVVENHLKKTSAVVCPDGWLAIG